MQHKEQHTSSVVDSKELKGASTQRVFVPLRDSGVVV